jgi:hypothetical protein
MSNEFKNYCESTGIKLKFASVAHPKTNRQVEKGNGIICNVIKKRLLAPLEKVKHAWVAELPSVLWSLRTTPNAATQETPSFLVDGAEAVLPVKITHEALMTHKYRGCIVVLSINKSIQPNEEQKVLTSGFDQGFTVNTSKRVFRGIW